MKRNRHSTEPWMRAMMGKWLKRRYSRHHRRLIAQKTHALFLWRLSFGASENEIINRLVSIIIATSKSTRRQRHTNHYLFGKQFTIEFSFSKTLTTAADAWTHRIFVFVDMMTYSIRSNNERRQDWGKCEIIDFVCVERFPKSSIHFPSKVLVLRHDIECSNTILLFDDRISMVDAMELCPFVLWIPSNRLPIVGQVCFDTPTSETIFEIVKFNFNFQVAKSQTAISSNSQDYFSSQHRSLSVNFQQRRHGRYYEIANNLQSICRFHSNLFVAMKL